jgi:hypothetical protein
MSRLASGRRESRATARVGASSHAEPTRARAVVPYAGGDCRRLARSDQAPKGFAKRLGAILEARRDLERLYERAPDTMREPLARAIGVTWADEALLYIARAFDRQDRRAVKRATSSGRRPSPPRVRAGRSSSALLVPERGLRDTRRSRRWLALVELLDPEVVGGQSRCEELAWETK